jgi:hypothetical protein
MGKASKSTSNDTPDKPVPSRIQKAMDLLLEAYQYAHSLGQDVWDFAVEIKVLEDIGLTFSDLRWLVCRSLVQHAREVTHMSDDQREFRPSGKLQFSERTCFVLTEAGVADKKMLNGEPASSVTAVSDKSQIKSVRRPLWDCDRRELRVGQRIVKQFKLPSSNQELVLMVFQEEGWPARIDDPLPPQTDRDPRQRLRDTIKSLNRHQKDHLISFRGDGTGKGILWEFCSCKENECED